MAKRGPKEKPTALKVLAGVRADRINADEPKPLPGVPDPPEVLDAEGLKEWHRVAPLLARMKVLTPADGSALAIYCQCYSRWVGAEEEIRKKGLLVTTDKGALKANPAVAMAQQAMAQCQRMLVEFGCTPSSRSRVNVVQDGPKDEFAAFMQQRKSQ